MSYTDATPDFELPQKDPQDTAVPRFYRKAVRNAYESDRQGRLVCVENDYIEILIPGDRRTVIDRPVREEDKRRWPRHWAAYQQGLEAPSEGTPITEAPFINRAQAEELMFMNVKTVEALAALDDAGIQRAVPMGGFSLREKARRFIEAAAGVAPTERLAAELAERDAKIAEQQRLIDDLSAKVNELVAKSKEVPLGPPA